MRTSLPANAGTQRTGVLVRLLHSTAVAFLLSGPLSMSAVAGEGEVFLRGTTGPADAYTTVKPKTGNFLLPTHAASGDDTGVAPNQTADEQLRTAVPLYPVSESIRAVHSTSGYIARNAVDVLLFRNTHTAINNRDVVTELPSREPLRQSMMHSVNYGSELRVGNASVADTISATLRGSYTARERMERANVERARMHGALANFLPKVEGVAELSRARRNTLSSGTFNQDIASIGIEASMPLFTSGVNTNTYRQARHVSTAADYSYLAEEHRASMEAVSAHVNLRLNRGIEQALARNVEAVKRILFIAKKLFKAGDASRTDIAIAQANVESARSELDVARRTREETQADYKSLTGKPAPRKLKLSKPENLVSATLEEAVATAMQNNPTLQSARHSAIASEHNAKVVRGRYGPQVDAFGRYDKYLLDSQQDNRKDDYTIGVRLRVPLIDFASVPTIDAARHEAAENGYKALEQGRLLKRQVERQWSGYQSAKRRVSIVRRQVKAVAQGLEGARREYKAGFRSITDVINEQVKLTRTKIALETAIHEKMLLAYELAFSTSQPSIQHLAMSR